MALATGTHAISEGAGEADDSWRLLRGVSYVRRAVAEDVRSPAFPMLRNQAGVGGVGTYWVTLVAGGLVEDAPGALTPRGVALAELFLRHFSTRDRAHLRSVINGEDVRFSDAVLRDWGGAAHLGAASKREKRLLADALLEPVAHRHMAAAMRDMEGVASDGRTFRLLGKHLRAQGELNSVRLAAVLAVALAFENLHHELLYRFNQIRAASRGRQSVPLKNIRIASGEHSSSHLGDVLRGTLDRHGPSLPHPVSDAVRSFSTAVEPAVLAQNDVEVIRSLVNHHERVQAGKLDAARLPKLPWLELNGNHVVASPRYVLDEPPEKPARGELTHPYRIEQFRNMLCEAGAWDRAT